MAIRKSVVMELAHPNAVGIDIGSASYFVAVPPDRDDELVREFKSFTENLEQLADWLIRCGMDIVAKKSMGVLSTGNGAVDAIHAGLWWSRPTSAHAHKRRVSRQLRR